MLLNKPSQLVPLVVALGCGPEVQVKGDSDWMLGTFSNRQVPDNTVGLTSVVRHEFREDGTLARTVVRGCGQNQEQVLEEYEWRREGESLVVVAGVREGESTEEWRVKPGETCDTVEVERVHDGVVWGSFTLMRGAVCMQQLPTCTLNCESCETVWCDAPPPACDE